MAHLVGQPYDQLPLWMVQWARDPGSLSFNDVNGDGILQFAELRIGPDLVMLAAPEIGGLPFVVSVLVAAGGLAAALSTADGLLLTIGNALAHDVYFEGDANQCAGHAARHVVEVRTVGGRLDCSLCGRTETGWNFCIWSPLRFRWRVRHLFLPWCWESFGPELPERVQLRAC